MTPERKARLLQVLCKRQNNITVVLENVSDPHNISAVMRSCDAVGIQEIYVLNTSEPRHKKNGAPKVLPAPLSGLRCINIQMWKNV